MAELTKEQIEYQRANIAEGMKAQDWDATTTAYNIAQLNAICDLALSALSDPARDEWARGMEEALDAWMKWYPDCAQLLDGWHADTAWTEWDENVRKRLIDLGTLTLNAKIKPGETNAAGKADLKRSEALHTPLTGLDASSHRPDETPAPAAPGWVPVSERLPEEHVEVWAYHRWPKDRAKQVRASWYKHSDGTICWQIETTSGHPHLVPPPSHWMPLPAAPTDKPKE